ncbi:MAG: ROK family protein [Candidatus Promineifilaceae bacterium]|nr:ROK family protein [Candidatus Promineifilaceae bacterium]
MKALGIDIGGSGIKGALVDTEKGELVTERYRFPTPRPAKPKAVITTIKKIVDHFDYSGPLGIGFPGIVVDGVLLSAVNIHKDWVGFAGRKEIEKATGCQVVIGNDADVAGIAEMRYGFGRNAKGVTMLFTLGTGIGSSMFVNQQLVPNLELGHLYLANHKKDVEDYTSDRARKEKELSWQEWGNRLNEYFNYIEFLFSPQRIIIGGGVSTKHKKFLKYIDVRAEVVPAELRNEAGIIGAAAAALSGGYPL